MLEALIIASERAANIARKCRQDKHLFKLLIEEKTDYEANPRFVQDFKTLADVLIQETLKHDLGKQYPEIKGQIKGEESNKFCNALGESIIVEKLDSCSETTDLLALVLNNDVESARVLAEEVHRELSLDDVDTQRPNVEIDFNYTQLGIWIDPIDSTAEYISGTCEADENEDTQTVEVSTNGLKCVTVLIGVYYLKTGEPVMGIINQPFHNRQNGRWRGKCYWGVHTSTLTCSSLSLNNESNKVVCLSSSEDQEIKDRLQAGGFSLLEVPGAGYKLLVVALGLADIYMLSRSSTFKWDTCGPHALLQSLAGGLVIYEDAVTTGAKTSISYLHEYDPGNKISTCSNIGGLIAYRNEAALIEIIKLLKDIKGKQET